MLVVLVLTSAVCRAYTRHEKYSDFIVFNVISEFIARHKAYDDVIVSNTYDLLEFGHYLKTLRVVFVGLTFLICVIGVPLYAILTVYFKNTEL